MGWLVSYLLPDRAERTVQALEAKAKDDREAAAAERKRLNDKIQRLEEKASFERRQFRDELADQQIRLGEEADRDREQYAASLQNQIAPFEKLAREFYPGIPVSEALARLRQDVRDLMPRSLSEDQASQIASSLQGSGAAKIEMRTNPTNHEALQFGEQLARAVRRAGWEVLESTSMPIGPGRRREGVLVLVEQIDQSVSVGRKLHAALGAAGIEAQLLALPSNLPPDVLCLVVIGAKPAIGH